MTKGKITTGLNSQYCLISSILRKVIKIYFLGPREWSLRSKTIYWNVQLWTGSWRNFINNWTPKSVGGPSVTHSGQIAKTRPKLRSKNSWNWVVILVSATLWRVLNVKCIKTGNGNDVNQLKIALKNSWNRIKLTYFWRILPIWNHSASRQWASRTIISWGVLPQAFLEKIARNALLWQKSPIELIALDLAAQCVISVDCFWSQAPLSRS